MSGSKGLRVSRRAGLKKNAGQKNEAATGSQLPDDNRAENCLLEAR